jgi:hypothetical protein
MDATSDHQSKLGQSALKPRQVSIRGWPHKRFCRLIVRPVFKDVAVEEWALMHTIPTTSRQHDVAHADAPVQATPDDDDRVFQVAVSTRTAAHVASGVGLNGICGLFHETADLQADLIRRPLQGVLKAWETFKRKRHALLSHADASEPSCVVPDAFSAGPFDAVVPPFWLAMNCQL